MPAAITSLAHYVPPTVLTNEHFASYLDTSDEWIRTRTGITQRHVSAGPTSELLLPAAKECLERRGMRAEDVDCILVATITPDYVAPSTAALLQHQLGASRAWGFDLSAACSGFVYGLLTAARLVDSGACRNVLLCAADRMTAILDTEDRTTAVLFGDGGGVVLVEPALNAELGVLDHICRMDGSGAESLYVPAGGSLRPATASSVEERSHYLRQDGASVYRAAVAGMGEMTEAVVQKNDLQVEQIRWFVPHQANLRIIQAVAKRVGMPMEKVKVNIQRYGNTTAGTIPICLSELWQEGKLETGDRVLLASFGAGFTMGAVYLRWENRTS